ncbi:MAG: TIGR03960 family B12-binding radical SAM protein [Deltaproteobacteria bacterium]|nr:TIGR03960 family B12-binding radical SAM protein [Candidatus Tharpella sp.]
MTKIEFDYELLRGVEKPGRYLNREVNSVYKEPGDEMLHMALAFPDLYELGMSNYGFLLLYQLINRQEKFFCERVFTPAADFSANLRAQKKSLFSLESSTPLKDFDLLGFSLSYEMAYTNVLLMLELAAIPWDAAERGEGFPLIIAGGPSMVNPEPVAPLFDAILIGDGEEAVIEIGELVLTAKKEGWLKSDLLLQLARIEGVYVSSLFQAVNHDDIVCVKPLRDDYTSVSRRVFTDLAKLPLPTTPPVPLIQAVHDRLAFEISRGCSRGCRFCQAGMIYRPVREQPPEKLFAAAAAGAAATGMEELSLLSLSVGDYTELLELVNGMKRACPGLDLSLPSVRAGVLNNELLEALKRSRQGGFTIAPEAGTQRLRDIINKGLSEEEILDTIENLFAQGWDLIKLYFMIGLPGETDADIEGIVELCGRALARSKNKRQRLNVSVSTFVPKPHTPFQWEVQIGLNETLRRQEIIRQGLKRVAPGRRLNFKWHDSRVSLLEGIFSRGDRSLWPVLKRARRLGCSFDAWSDHFDYSLWQKAFNEEGFSLEDLVARKLTPGTELAWSHIDCLVSEKFLEREREKALAQETTLDCRLGDCHGCGVCRPKQGIENISARTAALSETKIKTGTDQTRVLVPPPQTVVKEQFLSGGERREWRYQLAFSRSRRLSYLSHLENVAVIIRGLRRLKVPLAFSQGFHPHPKVSFVHALPVGLASQYEVMEFRTLAPVDIEQLEREWPQAMPSDLEFIDSFQLGARAAAIDRRLSGCIYQVRAEAPEDFGWRARLPEIEKVAGQVIAGLKPLVLQRIKKGKLKEINLAPHLKTAIINENGELIIGVAVLDGRNPNIFDIITGLAGLDQRPGAGVVVTKMKSLMVS